MKRALFALTLIAALFALSPGIAAAQTADAIVDRGPAWLENLVFRPVPMILPPPQPAERRILSKLTIGLVAPLSSRDTITLATTVVTADAKWELPIAAVGRSTDLACDTHRTRVVCRARRSAQIQPSPTRTIWYEARVTACPAEGDVVQVATYVIRGQHGDLLQTWHGTSTFDCGPIATETAPDASGSLPNQQPTLRPRLYCLESGVQDASSGGTALLPWYCPRPPAHPFS